MKKIYSTIITVVFTSNFLFSQSPYVDNSLLFSQSNYNGTARFSGMAGAFGALGGDQSSLLINPAGVGIYQSSELVFSPGLLNDKSSATYLGVFQKDNKYQMNISNFGFVASYDLKNLDTRWSYFNISVSFSKKNNFNRNIVFSGNNNHSIMEYFVDEANIAGSLQNLNRAYEYLIYDSYLMDYDSTYDEFWSQVTDEKWYIDSTNSFNLNQQKSIQTSGATNEVNIAFGANYNHKLYVGLSLGIISLNYEQNSAHYEYEDFNTTQVNDFKSLEFKEMSKISGTGVNLKLGAIYKPLDFLKLGFAFHLPTFYELEDDYKNISISDFDNGDHYESVSNEPKYDFTLTTPLKLVGSLGLQISKFALFDIDYEYNDYSTISLDDEFNGQEIKQDNIDIQNNFQATHSFRLGTEIKTGPFYLRGGFAYNTSPYKKTDYSLNHDNVIMTYAGGVGYREKNFFIDFAYVQSVNDFKLAVYPGNPYNASVDTKQNNFILSLGFKF